MLKREGVKEERERGEDREERVDSTELMEERGEDRKERVDSTELMKDRGETSISKLDNFNTHIINVSMKHFQFIF